VSLALDALDPTIPPVGRRTVAHESRRG
jgi:hypothetical protein